MAGSQPESRTIAFFLALAATSFPCTRAGATPPAQPNEPHAALLAAIRQVESGGDDGAVGDGGRSLGPLQVSRAAWQDATRHGRVEWSYDRLACSWAHSRQVALWYWELYRCRSDEQRSRVWNGGPRGHLKKSTLPYWRKVQRVLDGQ